MLGRGVPLVILISTLALSVANAAVDARGQEIRLDKPAARIISLAPHVTELVYAAGAGEKLIAAVDFSDYPDAARLLPRLGTAGRIDVERVVALAPDLVIGWKSGNNAGDLAKLERLGIPLYVTEITSLGEIPAQIENIGALAGTEEAARRASNAFRDRLAKLQDRYADREPITVFYQIWEHPLMTINGRHIIADGLRLCGGQNIFAALEPIAPVVSTEAVIAADPRAIIDSSSALDANGNPLGSWRRWKTMTAVQRGNLFRIPPDLIERPTPRILDGIERLCEALDAARASGRRN